MSRVSSNGFSQSKLKLVLFGDAQVGKSSILRCGLHDEFRESYVPTWSVNFGGGRDFAIQGVSENRSVIVWDVGGCERFSELLPTYFDKSDGLILVLDGTAQKKDRLAQLNRWMKKLEAIEDAKLQRDVPICVFVNKDDHSKKIAVDEDEKEAWKTAIRETGFKGEVEINIGSAKTGENVDAIFVNLAKRAIAAPATSADAADQGITHSPTASGLSEVSDEAPAQVTDFVKKISAPPVWQNDGGHQLGAEDNPGFLSGREYDRSVKLVIVGPVKAGKSSLVVRLTNSCFFLKNYFLKDYVPTIGIEFGTRIFTIQGPSGTSLQVELQIWDTAGHEQFQTIPRFYYKGSGGFILVLSANETRKARSAAVDTWVSDMNGHLFKGCPINIFVSHCELPATTVMTSPPKEEKRVFHNITPEEVKEWENLIKKNGFIGGVNTFFGSAKDGTNVEDVFVDLATRAIAAPATSVDAADQGITHSPTASGLSEVSDEAPAQATDFVKKISAPPVWQNDGGHQLGAENNPGSLSWSEHNCLVKLVIVGPAKAGKSSLLVRLTDSHFLKDYFPTIGVEFGTRIFTIQGPSRNPPRVKLQLWDLAGQEEFQVNARSYYKGSGGFILVLSANETRKARSAAVDTWVSDMNGHLFKGCPINIFVSHCELPGTKVTTSPPKEAEEVFHNITPEEVASWESLIKQNGFSGGVNTFFGSAMDGTNVEDVFVDLATRAVAAYDPDIAAEAQGIKIGEHAQFVSKTLTPESPTPKSTLLSNIKSTPKDFLKDFKSLPPAGKALLVIGILASIAALITLFTVPAVPVSGIAAAITLKLLVTLTLGATGGASIFAGFLSPRIVARRNRMKAAGSSKLGDGASAINETRLGQ